MRNELSTSDPVAALDFYSGSVGWEKGDAMPMGDQGDYRFINRHESWIGAIFPSQAAARERKAALALLFPRALDRKSRRIRGAEGGTIASRTDGGAAIT